jgi:hypothetical protein
MRRTISVARQAFWPPIAPAARPRSLSTFLFDNCLVSFHHLGPPVSGGFLCAAMALRTRLSSYPAN